MRICQKQNWYQSSGTFVLSGLRRKDQNPSFFSWIALLNKRGVVWALDERARARSCKETRVRKPKCNFWQLFWQVRLVMNQKQEKTYALRAQCLAHRLKLQKIKVTCHHLLDETSVWSIWQKSMFFKSNREKSTWNFVWRNPIENLSARYWNILPYIKVSLSLQCQIGFLSSRTFQKTGLRIRKSIQMAFKSKTWKFDLLKF